MTSRGRCGRVAPLLTIPARRADAWGEHLTDGPEATGADGPRGPSARGLLLRHAKGVLCRTKRGASRGELGAMGDSPVIERAAGRETDEHRRGQWLLLAGFLVLAAHRRRPRVPGPGAQQARVDDRAGRAQPQRRRQAQGGPDRRLERRAPRRRRTAEPTTQLLSAAVTDLLAGTRRRRVGRAHQVVTRRRSSATTTTSTSSSWRRTAGRSSACRRRRRTRSGPRVRALVAEARAHAARSCPRTCTSAPTASRASSSSPRSSHSAPGDPPVASVVLHVDPGALPLPLHPGLAAAE